MRKENKVSILVTGSSGFIGKSLIEHLKKDIDRYVLFCPSHSELELLDTKKVENFMSEKNIDLVIHCAGIGGSRKTAYDAGRTDVAMKNLLMFFNIYRMISPKQRIIYLGSGAEYDLRHYRPRMPEDYFDNHVPCDSYGFSKYVCSKYIEGSENIINLRIFGVFGRYEDYRYRFISNSIVKNILGMPITINQNAYLDYLYVYDFARIVEYFINNEGSYKFYNVCTGKAIDLMTIANDINHISAKRSEIIVKNPGLNTEYSGDNSRLVKETGNFEFTPFTKALKDLYLWYENNLDKIDRKAVEKDEFIAYCRTNKL